MVTSQVPRSQVAKAAPRNVDFVWDSFDSEDYFAHNYVALRDDDRQIAELVHDYFVAVAADCPPRPGARGLDVGTGTNLYPALTMLPFCGELTLYEYAASNVAWLRKEQQGHWPSWQPAWANFWQLLVDRDLRAGTGAPGPYQLLADPRAALSARASVHQGSVFDLVPHERQPAGGWDLGTMFFVAESITSEPSEFALAINRFLDALRPGAPFAIALMEHSTGYDVGDTRFPATDVDVHTVGELLAERAPETISTRIDLGDAPLRDGYSGMIVARGRLKGPR
jgi:hypothetical protein